MMATENPLSRGKIIVESMVILRKETAEDNISLFSAFFAANIAVELFLISLLVYMSKRHLIDVVILAGLITTMIIIFIQIVMSYRAMRKTRETTIPS
jgi:predicted lysophospholipase L1 biosynthesis ABC-type transport system permease subunit